MTSQNSKLVAALESILFSYGEPLEFKKIAKILKADISAVEAAAEELKQKLNNENSGLCIIENDGRIQLATKPEFSRFLEDFIKEEFKENLSPASLETLSLIAYLGPIPRSQIDYYRGVNSTFILRSLMMRGLVERFPDSKRQNLYLYQASFDLLKYLGIKRAEDLPDYDKYKQIVAKPETEGNPPQFLNPNF